MSRVPLLSVMASRVVGGAELGWIEIVEQLDPERVDLRLMCGPELAFDPIAARVAAVGGRIADRMRLHGTLDLAGRRRLARVFREVPGGVIHFNQTNLESCRSHISLARGCGCRLVSTLQDQDRKGPQFQRERRRRRTFGALDRVVCLSRAIAEDVAGYASPDRIEVIPLPLAAKTVERADSLVGQEPELRAKFGLPLDARIAVTVSVDASAKGQGSLIEHLPAARERVPNLLLLLVGGDPREQIEGLRSRAHELGCGDAVRWLGYRDDVLEVIAAADCLVHANATEGLGRVVQEALLVGTPVAAYRAGGVLDVLEKDCGGLLATPNSPSDLLDAACDLLSDPVWARALGERGRKMVQERFRADRIVARYHALFEALWEGIG